MASWPFIIRHVLVILRSRRVCHVAHILPIHLPIPGAPTTKNLHLSGKATFCIRVVGSMTNISINMGTERNAMVIISCNKKQITDL